MRHSVSVCVFILSVVFQTPLFGEPITINVRTAGAVNDGSVLVTSILQESIDRVSANGGGVVLVPRGTYLTGTLFLKSHVELNLQAGAVLLGSEDPRQYKRTDPTRSPVGTAYGSVMSLLFIQNQERVRITGLGEINGQGRRVANNVLKQIADHEINDPFYGQRPFEDNRPMILYITHSSEVTLTGITLKDAANWVSNIVKSQDVRVDGIRVESTEYWNNDGIQITESRNVRIVNSYVNAADDGICFKSGDPNGITENVYVGYNTVRTSASAVKFGTSSQGVYRNIVVEHITVFDNYRSAIALEIVDGGVMDSILISDIHGVNTGNAIFIRLGDRNPNRPPGTLQNIVIRNLDVEVPLHPPDEGYPIAGPWVLVPHNRIPSSITGLPGHPVRNITLENVTIRFAGGGRKERAYLPPDSLHLVPELADSYPEFSMFGELPAYGLYIRHAENIVMKNVRIDLVHRDYRSAIVTDDVDGLRIDGLLLNKIGEHPPLWLDDTRGVQLNGVRVPDIGSAKLIERRGSQ
jgi:pectate lyase